jgi:uncharacterized membrane protein YraQ (UPF0718 family)/copper chaperone CopZ
MDFLFKIWSLLIEISPFLLFGFLFSGILSVALSVETVAKYLGGRGIKSIFLASLFGIPLPLCSCGVIPVFSYLKKHGASKASTTSFLTSTPQTGVDSIMVTYGLLGPVFAIYRPVIAFISGIIGGTLVSVLDKEESIKKDFSSCNDDCCDEEGSVIWRIFDYGFIKLAQDIAQPLIIGIVVAALIFFFIPPNYFQSIGTGIIGMLIMLVLGLPSYICATASIPMALALHVQGGFSMGSLMVFLMCGPATNIATISVSLKQIGKKSTLIYIGSIVLCSILSGLLFDVMFPGITVEDSLSSSMHMVPHSVGVLSAWALILILLNSIRLNYFSSSIKNIQKSSNVVLFIKGMKCNNCVSSINKTVNQLPGIKVVDLDLKSGRIEVDCNSEDLPLIKKSIIDLGFEIVE